MNKRTLISRDVREILKEAIATAKMTGLWYRFTLSDKKALVTYFYLHFLNCR